MSRTHESLDSDFDFDVDQPFPRAAARDNKAKPEATAKPEKSSLLKRVAFGVRLGRRTAKDDPPKPGGKQSARTGFFAKRPRAQAGSGPCTEPERDSSTATEVDPPVQTAEVVKIAKCDLDAAGVWTPSRFSPYLEEADKENCPNGTGGIAREELDELRREVDGLRDAFFVLRREYTELRGAVRTKNTSLPVEALEPRGSRGLPLASLETPLLANASGNGSQGVSRNEGSSLGSSTPANESSTGEDRGLLGIFESWLGLGEPKRRPPSSPSPSCATTAAPTTPWRGAAAGSAQLDGLTPDMRLGLVQQGAFEGIAPSPFARESPMVRGSPPPGSQFRQPGGPARPTTGLVPSPSWGSGGSRDAHSSEGSFRNLDPSAEGTYRRDRGLGDRSAMGSMPPQQWQDHGATASAPSRQPEARRAHQPLPPQNYWRQTRATPSGGGVPLDAGARGQLSAPPPAESPARRGDSSCSAAGQTHGTADSLNCSIATTSTVATWRGTTPSSASCAPSGGNAALRGRAALEGAGGLALGGLPPAPTASRAEDDDPPTFGSRAACHGQAHRALPPLPACHEGTSECPGFSPLAGSAPRGTGGNTAPGPRQLVLPFPEVHDDLDSSYGEEDSLAGVPELPFPQVDRGVSSRSPRRTAPSHSARGGDDGKVAELGGCHKQSPLRSLCPDQSQQGDLRLEPPSQQDQARQQLPCHEPSPLQAALEDDLADEEQIVALFT